MGIFVFFYSHITTALISVFISGQPHILERSMGQKIVLYSAFMANGECWPPVLFTNKPLPNQGSRGILRLRDPNQFAFVHYLPDSKSASTKHTEIWLEDMNSKDADMLQGPHHLLLDKAKWHT